MEPTIDPRRLEDPQTGDPGIASNESVPEYPEVLLKTEHNAHWVLLGPQGLRAGWSVLLFVSLYYLLTPALDTIAVTLDPTLADAVFTPSRMLITEFIPFIDLVIVCAIMARFEQRRLVDYNLTDARHVPHFFGGLIAGFAALSLLVGVLALGGWMHFGGAELNGTEALKFGFVWACAFLLVALFEEGTFRGYLQFTLTRGISFWWALVTVAALCLLVSLNSDSKGTEGVYAVAALGLVPCWLLHRAHDANSGFWQAAWTTSTAFGYYHTNNNGENWIGILAAASIGFVFCVSVRVTGSAWWAIGCHSAWDWAETFFYGTPDSGLAARRHLFTASASGNALWSGGADGPEGSLLVMPVILLLLVLLLVVYRRARPIAISADAAEHVVS